MNSQDLCGVNTMGEMITCSECQELKVFYKTNGKGERLCKECARPVAPPIRKKQPKPRRNELCPCNSGKKFKKCCKEFPELTSWLGYVAWVMTVGAEKGVETMTQEEFDEAIKEHKWYQMDPENPGYALTFVSYFDAVLFIKEQFGHDAPFKLTQVTQAQLDEFHRIVATSKYDA